MRAMSDDSGSPPRSRWRPAAVFTALALLATLAIVLVLSFDRPLVGRRDPETDNAYVGGDVTRLAAHVTGYIRALPVADNQPVRAGDLIAEIEDDDYRAQRDQARANLAAAQAQAAAIDGQRKQLAEQIEQTRTGETQSRADLGRTAPELARQELLVRTDLGVRRALDQAQADQRRMTAGLEAARAQTTARERQADVLAAQLEQARATVAARQADLDLAQVTLDWTRITAPVDGTLGARLVRVGDLVSTGTQLVRETPLDTVWVDANFTERQIVDIRPGQPARLRVDAFPDQPLDGRVVGFSPTTGGALSAVPPDNTTGNFTKVVQRVPVRIAIEWRGSPLRGLVRPGMSVTATVRTGSQQ
jgi:membrane fusion protein (multidrug efflux system)